MSHSKMALNEKTAQLNAVPAGTEKRAGLEFQRRFTDGRTSPFDAVEWERRVALIGNEKGKTIFRQEDVEVPKGWSQTATNIVASKYFHGKPNTPEREGSVRQLISRVVNTIVRWGEEGGYFAGTASRDAFRDELTHLLVEQKMAFNSPVWFNVGVQPKPQCSACFINSVQDNMESIMTLTKTEGMLFKWGSGTGTNFSTLRGSRETLSGGGIASGPVSFMKGFDAFAGVIKSGGKTRRAAKMVILNVDHPDIVEFIDCKMKEEHKAQVLIEQGYDPSIDGEAYSSVFFQNANHSVRVTDEFMQAVEEDRDYWTRNVNDGNPNEKHSARELLQRMADSAWHCGDPGMQYDTTVNRWHTCKTTARINASNPCSEYMFLDDTACNLASLNLMKYLNSNGSVDVEAFRHAVDITITAQEILVDNASYPTPKIADNSHKFRPLGLGYANLGALLMSMALPYDSDGGRDMAGAVTALMCGEAYAQSARIAERLGPFAGYAANREPMLEVIRMHRDSLRPIKAENVQPSLLGAAQTAWDIALALGEKFGYRNSQMTVLAPTGTIGFMMDCDTTGIEPDLALVKYKKLVGGGVIKIVNNTVPAALMKLGYTPEQSSQMVTYIDRNGKIEGAPGFKAGAPAGFRLLAGCRGRTLDRLARPSEDDGCRPTVPFRRDQQDHQYAPGIHGGRHHAGVSGVVEAGAEIRSDLPRQFQRFSTAIRRGRQERHRAAGTDRSEGGGRRETPSPVAEQRELFRGAHRRKLPSERASITHKFSIGGHEGYITVGMYEDKQPGEIFIKMAKEGSTLSGFMDGFALSVSIGLQYGVPLKALVDKFINTRFEPAGFTGHPAIPYAKSVLDYIARWLGGRFISPDYLTRSGDAALPTLTMTAPAALLAAEATADDDPPSKSVSAVPMFDGAPTCSECGMLMTPNGACYKCENCGGTSGCS